MFKLNRMDGVQKAEKIFECRDATMPDLSNEKIFPGGIKVKALFEPPKSLCMSIHLMKWMSLSRMRLRTKQYQSWSLNWNRGDREPVILLIRKEI